MNDSNSHDVTQDHQGNLVPQSGAALVDHPQRIGRYRIEKILGNGGFGLVYLAHDEQLDRDVAVKVPHASLISRPEDAEVYLAEARTVASLDHPGIVPVHDVGSTDNCPCYVVSKYIDGADLSIKLKHYQPTYEEAAELMATVADVLHYAHGRGLVHRDVKPGNILIDKDGQPYVVDFGLALREEDIGQGPKYVGTAAYMSPEQARGEGHRVDGRSDIFSLGVVLYELLVGHKPFQGNTRAELFEQITNHEPRPLRQYDDQIPKELERICHKAMAKRASERYRTAKEISEDLRHFLTEPAHNQSRTSWGGAAAAACETEAFHSTSARTDSVACASASKGTGFSSDSQPVRIIPKGLRSFDAHDADFFLELLPGPRDRGGLPDNLRFWKNQIEEFDPDGTFSVGLIYGPSGCGKSSLVKAGLLPRLSKDIVAVYVEATPEETETRLLHGLRKRCPALDGSLSLKATLAALRQGRALAAGKKVLIVLDQFEQWLHARKGGEEIELVQSLRQCDGGRVQCIVMVRDDFWLAVSRFLRALEVRLVEGENSALADLFDIDHAQKVLAAYGRAFGKLPETIRGTAQEQREFLKQSVAGLADNGKVVCVRLALFAEMMKSKSWTPATLKQVGGTTGVGATFLEETFSASTAPPERRYHQQAARAVLKALLPQSGTDIKGEMKSYEELLEISGYARRRDEFDDLIRILDSEVRLISPTDPEGVESVDDSVSPAAAGHKYYQLTHDYLVHSLRDWLTRKQKETRRGRAELLMADRATVWNARPENRQLPSLIPWLQIKWFTDKKNWTPSQRKMMVHAGRYQAVRSVAVALLLAIATFAGLMVRHRVGEQQRGTYAVGLVQRLLDAETTQAPAIVKEMTEYREWIDPLLREEDAKTSHNSRQKLHLGLALLPVDRAQVDGVYRRLLDAEPREVPVIRDALAPYKDGLLEKLWGVVQSAELPKESQRLRAAAALAKYDSENEKWGTVQEVVANDLVNVPALHLATWMDALRPVRTKLFPQLTAVYRDAARREMERSLATDFLADYAADQPQLLADLLMDADEKQFAVIFPKFTEHAEQGIRRLVDEIDRRLPADVPSSDELREVLAKRQANAAVALLRVDQPAKVWPLFKHSPDPRVRSYLIHRLSPLGADAKSIVRHLDDVKESEPSSCWALLLSLGEYREDQFSPKERMALLPTLQEMYRTDADPGLHAATEWLLQTWQQGAWLNQENEKWAKDPEQRTKQIEGIRQAVPQKRGQPLPQWYVNGQGQTMIVIPGPVEFLMGSPVTESHRGEDEPQHKTRIDRTFAIAAKLVSVEQYKRFAPDFHVPAEFTVTTDSPVSGIDWFKAAAYCNWLSAQEHIEPTQWSYETENGKVTALKKDYLSLTGYRLPTEAEMEYVTRAGAATSRYFGETEELLPKYAWFTQNSPDKPRPVGKLKPNDLGFFDAQGNVFTWCQESYKSYPAAKGDEVTEDREDDLVIQAKANRVLRGGSFVYRAAFVRSADRDCNVPTRGDYGYGFRVARTSGSSINVPSARPDQGFGTTPHRVSRNIVVGCFGDLDLERHCR